MEPQNESTPGSVTTRSVGIRYGLILGAVSIVSFLVMSLTGISMMEGPGRWVSWIYVIVVLFLAQKYYKDNGDGYMTIGQGVGVGFWAGLVSSVLSSIFVYIYVKFVDSGFMELIKNKQYEDMQARGMSDEQIEQAMKFASMFTTPEAILIFGIVFGIIGGLVVGLVLSFFMQKKNPDAIPS